MAGRRTMSLELQQRASETFSRESFQASRSGDGFKASISTWRSPSVFSASLGSEIQSETPLHRGYLNKLSQNKFVKKWQQRFFVLYPGKMYYWAEEKDFLERKKAKGLIELTDCSLATAEQHTKRVNTIGIFHTERRDYFLEAPNKKVLSEWVTLIEGILGVYEEKVTLNDFEVLNLVGKGSYGMVVQVRKKDSGKIYAMKMISKAELGKKNSSSKSGSSHVDLELELSKNQSLQGSIDCESAVYKRWLIQSTKAERRVLEVVNHPFIVKLHFAFQTSDRLCLVMDFINGGELFSCIARDKMFNSARTRFYTAELILALEYLHEMSIIYRDLKPENILLDSAGHIVLTDFGHSKDEHSRNDRSYSMVGSAYYTAPEILLNKGHGKDCDWWSLGILVYEMAVGLPPFYCDNPRQTYEKLLTKPIEFPDHVQEDMRKTIRSLLHVDATRRLGSERAGMDPPGNDTAKLRDKWNTSWLKDVNWEAQLRRQVEAPWKPKVKGVQDISNFSSHFTDDILSFPQDEGRASGKNCDIFQDFDFVAPVASSLLPQISPRQTPQPHMNFDTLPPTLSLTGQAQRRSSNASSAASNEANRRSSGEVARRQSSETARRSSGEVQRRTSCETSRQGGEYRGTEGGPWGGIEEGEGGERREGGKQEAKEEAEEGGMVWGETTAGRKILSEIPEAMNAKLLEMEEKGKAKGAKPTPNPQLGAMVVCATDLLQDCRWDMSLAAASLSEAVKRRCDIEQCFSDKGAAEGPRLEELQACLTRIITTVHNRTKGVTLSAESGESTPTAAAADKPPKKGLKREDSWAGKLESVLVSGREAERVRSEKRDALGPLPESQGSFKQADARKRRDKRGHSENDLGKWAREHSTERAEGKPPQPPPSYHAYSGVSSEEEEPIAPIMPIT